jgi:hypothetical protein
MPTLGRTTLQPDGGHSKHIFESSPGSSIVLVT